MKKGGDRSFVGGRKTEENQRSALWKRGGRRRKEPSAAAHSPHSAHLFKRRVKMWIERGVLRECCTLTSAIIRSSSSDCSPRPSP